MIGSRAIRISVVAFPLGETDNHIGAASLRSHLSAAIFDAVDEVESVYGDDVAVAITTEAIDVA